MLSTQIETFIEPLCELVQRPELQNQTILTLNPLKGTLNPKIPERNPKTLNHSEPLGSLSAGGHGGVVDDGVALEAFALQRT